MKTVRAALGAGALAAAALVSSREARALGPIDLEIGAKAGVGTNPTSGSPNPLGFGLGGRAGIAFLGGIYAGVNLMYYLGGSTPSPGFSVHTLQYGLELGYGLKILILTIRPQLGLGNMVFSVTTDQTPLLASQSQSNGSFYLEPGVVALVELGALFVGADANLLVLPSVTDAGATTSSTDTAFTLHGQVGLKF